MVTKTADIKKLQKEEVNCVKCTKIIKPYYDEEFYKCDGCDDYYCYDCDYPNRYSIKCTSFECFYCRKGSCLNNRNEYFGEDTYCNDCYVENCDDYECYEN